MDAQPVDRFLFVPLVVEQFVAQVKRDGGMSGREQIRRVERCFPEVTGFGALEGHAVLERLPGSFTECGIVRLSSETQQLARDPS